jgi:hypothetical protein
MFITEEFLVSNSYTQPAQRASSIYKQEPLHHSSDIITEKLVLISYKQLLFYVGFFYFYRKEAVCFSGYGSQYNDFVIARFVVLHCQT